MIVVTGATGQLGRLVIAELLKKLPASGIIAAVRDPAKARELAEAGITVRQADYSQPHTLDQAFAGAEKILLISSSEVGQRLAQHQAVIAAASKTGVKLLAYTSILHADTSPLGLAAEHLATEQAITASGIPSVILRNAWYTENYTAALGNALAHGVIAGSAANGRIASATRADYAAAAAAVLLADNQAGKVYELAGDEAYTLTELAAEVSRLSGKDIQYKNLPETEYKALLVNAGLPEAFAALLADSDAGAAKGGLFDDSHQLSHLIGRPTTPLTVSIAQALGLNSDY